MAVDVQGDEVTLGQEVAQALDRLIVAHGQLLEDVVEQHPEAESLGHDADLPANVTVADDAEDLAADFVGFGGGLEPAAGVHVARPVPQLARQHDHLGQDQLGHAPGVGEGRVEHRDAAVLGLVESDLVGADAKAPDAEQAS